MNIEDHTDGTVVRVLLVDEHQLLRRSVRLMISGLKNFEVCGEAANGREAIAKAQELKPDVVITPISLPQLNGLEAARQIRRLLPNVKLVVLSQHDIPQARDEAAKAGAAGFVPKSSVWELVPMLRKLQSGRTPPQEGSIGSTSAQVSGAE